MKRSIKGLLFLLLLFYIDTSSVLVIAEEVHVQKDKDYYNSFLIDEQSLTYGKVGIEFSVDKLSFKEATQKPEKDKDAELVKDNILVLIIGIPLIIVALVFYYIKGQRIQRNKENK